MFPFVDKMSVSDSLLNVSKSVLNYATIIHTLHSADKWFSEVYSLKGDKNDTEYPVNRSDCYRAEN